jgi:outer membrane protein assembly factor BamB
MNRALSGTRRSGSRSVVAFLACAALGLAAPAALAVPGLEQASASVLAPATAPGAYAYADGAATSPTSCPQTTVASEQCTLTQALLNVTAGGDVLLATSGKSGPYYGNFAVRTAGTTAALPVTIEPAAGVTAPVINSDASGAVPCPTGACEGAPLTIAAGVFAQVQSLTITDGDDKDPNGGGGIEDFGTLGLTGATISDCQAQVGGAIAVGNGAALTVSDSDFTHDQSTYFGGAIDSGSVIEGVTDTGDVTVAGSTFTFDQSQRGGAIDSGDLGTGTLTVTDSVFDHDSATSHGGAIDTGDAGSGTATVTGATFAQDSAPNGAAIDNGDADGQGTLTVRQSTFSYDSATNGGAIDNGARGNGTVTITSSTFYADQATSDGSVIDNGGAGGAGSVVILDSTIDASRDRPAIDQEAGSVDIAGSIVTGSQTSCPHKLSDDGYNLITNATANCGFSASNGDLVGVSPDLGPLASNGGPTRSLAPARTSPVLERIPSPAVANLSDGNSVAICPLPDQRGTKRGEAYGCAIGSVDPENGVPVVTSLGSTLGPAAGGGILAINGGNFAAGAAVSFGPLRATHVDVVSPTLIKVRIPALPGSDSAMSFNVRVTNKSGLASPYRAAQAYGYYTANWSANLDGAGHSSYNPAATAITPSLVASLKPVWQWQPASPPKGDTGKAVQDASPIVYKGVSYVGLQDGYLNAVSEQTGKELWKKPPFLGVERGRTCPGGTRGITSTATVADDPVTGRPVVYVNAPDGYLYALNAATGAVLWRSVVGIPSTAVSNYYAWGSPTVANGKVYIGIASRCGIPLVQAGVLSFSQKTGKRAAYWESLPANVVGGSVSSSVAVLPNGDVAAATGHSAGNNQVRDAESIVILNGTTLKLLGSWMVPGGQASGFDFDGSPTVFTAYPNGVETTMIGVCDEDGIYYALRVNDMNAGPLWQYQLGAAFTGAGPGGCDSAAIWNGQDLIVGGGSAVMIDGTSYSGSVQALDPTTGQPAWQTGLDGTVVGSPAQDAGGVVAAPVLSPGGDAGVYLLDASDGTILRFISTAPSGVFAQPVFDGQSLLIADESATLPLTEYKAP